MILLESPLIPGPEASTSEEGNTNSSTEAASTAEATKPSENKATGTPENDKAQNEETLEQAQNEGDAQGHYEGDGHDHGHTRSQYVPYLTAINVETGKEQLLLEMPPQLEITVSLSPDSLAILFDEALVREPEATALSSERSEPTHRLWLLPLFSTPEERLNSTPAPLSPAELDITGRQPTWLP